MARAKKDLLDANRKKRDYGRSPEPAGGNSKPEREPVFVIQKHQARSLHYDLRLEVGGVLKSWAVPKGPSTDAREKRLAIATEDHPLEYADFEGTIPDTEYGGGTVLVWDRGTYRNMMAEKEGEPLSVERALERGHLEVWLEGRKLKGGYALIRTRRNRGRDWLLMKMKDEEADARRKPVSTQPRSVSSGRTMEEIAKEATKSSGGE